MPRRIGRVDGNQGEIVDALREVGATVQPIHTVGRGCPDLLVGFRGVNYLAEVKDGSKPPSGRRLTKDEGQWHRDWRGDVVVIESVEDALRMIGIGVYGMFPAVGKIGT